MAVAPSMAVLWVIPRPFYQDDSTGITAVTGALQPDVTPLRRLFKSDRCHCRWCRELWPRTASLARTEPEHNSCH